MIALFRIPGQWAWLQESWPIFGADIETQYHFLLADVPYDMLREVDGLLPTETAVLLVTTGAGNREYTIYHRALYFLTPRPVWWMAPAPLDETWGSNWRLSAPLTAESITKIAQEKQLTCVLTLQSDLIIGEKLVAWPEGVLWQVGGKCPIDPHEPTAVRGNWLWAGVGVFILWLAGYVVLWGIGHPATGLEGASLAWIMGTGVVSALMGWFSVAGDSLTSQTVGLTTAVLLAAWFRRKDPKTFLSSANSVPLRLGESFFQWTHQIKQQSTTTILVQTALMLLLLWQVGFVGLLAVGRPLTSWDSWVNWGMKARMLYQTGLTPAFYAEPSRFATMVDYPLLLPMVETWLYQWAGAADDRLAGLISLLFYLAGMGVLYSAVSRWAPRLALVAVVAWASLNYMTLLFAVVYTDVVVAVLGITAVIYLREWQKEQTTNTLLITLLAIGLLPWTKREGLVIAMVLCLSTLLLRIPPPGQRGRFIIGSLIAVALLSGFWLAFTHFYVPPNPNFLPITLETLWVGIGRLPRITWMILKLLAGAGYNYLWPLLIVIGLYNRQAIRSHSYHFPLLAAVLYIGLMSATYIVSNFLPYQQHIASSAYRLVAQVVAWPVVWLVLWEETKIAHEPQPH